MTNFMTIQYTHWGLVITSTFGDKQKYVGYTKRESIRLYREQYGMKGKHITVLDI